MRRLRRPSVLVVGLALVAASVAPVAAESALWTLTASPLAATTGTPITFTLQATNDDPLAALLSSSRIGCVQVDVPANFSVATTQVTGSSSGSWTPSLVGNRVLVQAVSGGDRLRTLDWVRFTVRATAASTGSSAWASRAFERTDCGGTGALLAVPPLVVVTNPIVAPTPLPTPLPTLLPTPGPTPTPIPLPTILPSLPPIGETPRPTATPGPSDRPTESDDPRATPTPTPTPTPGPATSRAPGASPGPDPSATGPAASDDGPDGGVAGGPPALPGLRESGPAVLAEPADLELGGAGIGLAGIGVWIVPGAAIAGPGLLILLWIALQAVGAFAWIPAVRRLRGDGDRVPA